MHPRVGLTAAVAIALSACARTNATAPDYGGGDGRAVSPSPSTSTVGAVVSGPPADAGAQAIGMVTVKGGSYEKGLRRDESSNMPSGYHFRVAVAPFAIDRTEVTVGAYAACVQEGRCTAEMRKCKPVPPDVPDHPMTCVNQMQAAAYCRWQGKRLPSDAEWEFAARGGDGRSYPWGDAKPDGVCIGRDTGATGGSADVGTCTVGTHAQDTSPFGVLDMAGNVSEWTSTPSAYAEGYDDPAERGGYEPDSEHAIVRGGSWGDRAGAAAAVLMKRTTFDRTPAVGFRCALSLSPGDGGAGVAPDQDAVDGLPRVREGQMVHVAGGTLAPSLDGGESARAGQAIAVAAFDIDVTEVTAMAYAKCVEAKRCVSTLPGDPAMRGYEQSHSGVVCSEGKEQLAGHPMNCVSAKQAAAYCAWAGKRLPTEGEWQLAAGGADRRSLPWGEADPKKRPCWDRPGGDVPYTGTCPVATHPDDASPSGVFDMAGNVGEWTTGNAGAGFVSKGGSWQTVARYFTSLAARTDRTNQPDGDDTIGFRCAR